MKTDKTKIFAEIRRYVIITFALLMMAFGWTGFLIPQHVLGGGVSGIATLIYYATGISTGISVFVINGILVLISLKVLGPSFGIKTVYSIIMASVFFSLLQHYITDPILAGEMAPLVDDKFLSALIGGALAGIAIGIGAQSPSMFNLATLDRVKSGSKVGLFAFDKITLFFNPFSYINTGTDCFWGCASIAALALILLFTRKNEGKLLKITKWLAILFMVLSILLNLPLPIFKG